MRPLASLLAVGLSAAGIPGAENPPPSLQTAVRHAVAARQVRDSDLKGSARAGEPFRAAVREGGVLVGLEVGLGRVGSAERVLAVRPVYRLGAMEWPGPAAGDFLAPEVVRTARSVARLGYAVSGLWVNAAGDLTGVALAYRRVTGPWLDARDRYESHWLRAQAAPAELIDGRGRPVVGLFGRVEGGSLRALGLTFADLPEPVPSVAAPASADRPKSELEIENVQLRAARAAAQAGSGGPWWFAGLAAALVPAGLGAGAFWVWRWRGRARPGPAEPVLKPVSPNLAARWLPIRPRAGGLIVPGDEVGGGGDDPPSIPADYQWRRRPPPSGTFEGRWR
jgi:hypothetical protein